MNSLQTKAARFFAGQFGRSPAVFAAAPGRVNFIGEHTDYNDGWVLPMAIDRRTLAAAAVNGSRVARICSDNARGMIEIGLDRSLEPAPPAWGNYVRGVIAELTRLGFEIPGFDACFVSEIPPGAGLSSSAALEVATATLLEALTGRTLDPMEKARLCQRAEHEFAGVPCGIMDQFASVFGRAGRLLLLDCRDGESRAVPWPESMRLLVINSGVHHELASGEYARRRSECANAAGALGVRSLRDATMAQLAVAELDETLRRRARHVISENDRTLECARALEAGDWSEVGRLMYSSHESLRNDYEVSCPELDLLVAMSREIGPDRGVHGARMTGGGFGGSVIVLVERDQADRVRESLAEDYGAKIGHRPDAFATAPAAGAAILEPG